MPLCYTKKGTMHDVTNTFLLIPGPSSLAADHTHLLLTPLGEEVEMKIGLSYICALVPKGDSCFLSEKKKKKEKKGL